MSRPVVAFIHVHKAGGTTFTRILERLYPGRVIVRADDPADIAATLSEETDVVRGPHLMGLHEHTDRPVRYVTILRDPVERVVSGYHYIRRSREHGLHDRVVGGDLSLEAFVEARMGTLILDNGQTRMLSGQSRVPFGSCTPQMLTEACRNLDTFAAHGILERFDEFLLWCTDALGWPSVPGYDQLNVGRERPPAASLDASLAERIREHNALDIELFAHAEHRFSEALRGLRGRRRRLWALRTGQRGRRLRRRATRRAPR